MDFRKSLRTKLSKVVTKLNENLSIISKPLKEDETSTDFPIDELSPEAIAQKHGVSVDDIKKEIEIGTEHEQEEHGDIARHIASQHVNEHPKFYTDKKYGADVTEKQLDEVDQNQVKAAQINAAKESEQAANAQLQVDQLKAKAAQEATNKAKMNESADYSKVTNKNQYFKEAWKRVKQFYYDSLLTESKELPSFCYMLYLQGEEADKFKELQDSLDIKAGEMVPKTKFHVTIRYMKTNKDIKPFLDWIKDQDLPEIIVTGKEFAKYNDAFVLEVQGSEIRKWFEKVNKWLVDNGYPKSDYPEYKPHLSFSYETSDDFKIPKYDDKPIRLKFTKHVVTNDDHKVIWSKEV